MQLIVYLSTLIGVIVLPPTVGAQDAAIKASVEVSSFEVPQNREVTFSIKVSWIGELSRFEVVGIETPELTNLVIRTNASSDWTGLNDSQKSVVKTFEFRLMPQAIGMAYIDGTTVNYRDLSTGETHKLMTNRVEIKVIEPVVQHDWSGMLWAGTMLLVVFVSLALLLRARRKKQTEPDESETVTVSLEEQFLQKLKEKIDLKGQATTEAFSILSSLLRKYLAEKYQLPSSGLSSSEISGHLNDELVEAKIREQIGEVLTTCDVAKFSGGQADSRSLERAYTLTESLLHSAKMSGEGVVQS